jgi:hypothetical protein
VSVETEAGWTFALCFLLAALPLVTGVFLKWR